MQRISSASRNCLLPTAYCLLILGGCYYEAQLLGDQAELIYPGTTAVNTEEASVVSKEIWVAGYAMTSASRRAQRDALDMLYRSAGELFQGLHFRLVENKRVEWLPAEEAPFVPSSQLRVAELIDLPAAGLFRAQARAYLTASQQKQFAELPAIAAIGNAPVAAQGDLLAAWSNARDAAVRQGILRMAWYRYSSKVPSPLTGTVFIEKYFQDPLAHLYPDQTWRGTLQLILKVRVKLDEPATSGD